MAVNFDARAKREELIAQKAIANQDRERAMQAVNNIRDLLDRMDRNVIEMLFSKGVNVKTLLTYDLDRIYKDAEYQREFIAEGNRVLTELENFIRLESGV